MLDASGDSFDQRRDSQLEEVTVGVEKMDSVQPAERISGLPRSMDRRVVTQVDASLLESLNDFEKVDSVSTNSNVIGISHWSSNQVSAP